MPSDSTSSVGFANARRVVQLHRDAADGRGLAHQVARGAGDVGDDGAVLFQQAIEQAALADVGPADDGQREPLPHQAAIAEAGGELRRALQDRARGGAGSRRPGATLISSSAKSMPASSSAISSSSCSLSGAMRRDTEPSTCCAATRAW